MAPMTPRARLTDIWGGPLLLVDPVDHDPPPELVLDALMLLLLLLVAVLLEAEDVLDAEVVLDC